MDSFIFLLLLLLLLNYSVISLTNHFNFPCFLALLCESWFTYTWFVILSTKWTPARVITYLYAIPPRAAELPAVDLLVTTADPVLEPPIITVNTVLSLALRPKKVELQSLELKSSQPRVELSSGLLSQISEVVASHPPADLKLRDSSRSRLKSAEPRLVLLISKFLLPVVALFLFLLIIFAQDPMIYGCH
ncbi:hypothetical protein K1719_021395 [Acacia pycnantha]|nr:hypothetical protein K1719_021395 [Acacia pycnantha]